MKAVIFVALMVLAVSALEQKRQYRTALKEANRSAVQKPSGRIVGGQEALPNSLPYQVYLDVFARVSGIYLYWACSGSIITKNFVLTSARCVNDALDVWITMGAHDMSHGETTQIRTQTEYVYVHSGYNSTTLQNDIALLRMMNFEITFNDYIQPVALPSNEDILNLESFVGTTARASGWGLTNGDDDASSSTVLKFFDAQVMRNSDCKAIFDVVDATMMCTTAGTNSGVCRGDVGGPLVTTLVDEVKQIGIASFWATGCVSGSPSGFTRITAYMDWIVATSDYVMQ